MFQIQPTEWAFGIYESHQRQLVDCSDPTCSSTLAGPMKLNSLLNALGRLVSEAGSEQSTHSRGWDSRMRSPLSVGWP